MNTLVGAFIPAIPYQYCPAKAYVDSRGNPVLGYGVFEHCYIVGIVARQLSRRLPLHLQSFFPSGFELISACHDLGKVSPSFYLKLLEAISHPLTANDYRIKRHFDKPAEIDRGLGGHSTISAVELRDQDHLMAGLIAGSHHGVLNVKAASLLSNDELLGGELWQAERAKLLMALKSELNSEFPDIHPKDQLLGRVLSGITSVADWIGSGELFKVPKSNLLDVIEEDVARAIDEAGFYTFNAKRDLTFQDMFGLDAPNSLQLRAEETLTEPSVIVIEAPMGMGKTEAALNLAYKCLTQFNATGIYFGLPTQLTSNKMYDRFQDFLIRILETGVAPKLLHNQSWLLKTQMGSEAEAGHDWFDQAKRGLLAPFAVGTIDQALMSVVNVKHNFVRSFGLLGKVVILDEVHSYDVYTGLLMDELVKHLVELKCTVIILSATLNVERKAQLMGVDRSVLPGCQSYPSITIQKNSDKSIEVLNVDPPVSQAVLIKNESEFNTLEEARRRALQGQYVLWIENTVGSSIHVYQELLASLDGTDVEIGLIHSRFTVMDRLALEEEWVAAYGKADSSRNKRGRILIGTQILEQSLDIDADFMVSRFAPTDFILQRLGRLWRHQRDNRHQEAQREAWIISPSLEDAIADTTSFGNSEFIYGAYTLLKSLKAWQSYFAQGYVTLPGSIPAIIESTYAANELFDAEIEQHQKVFLYGGKGHKGILELRTLAKGSLARLGVPQKKDRVSTRYMDNKMDTVYLFERVEFYDGILEFYTLSGDMLRFDKSLFERDKFAARKFLLGFQMQSTQCPHYYLGDKLIEQHQSIPVLRDIYKMLRNSDSCIAVVKKGVLDDAFGLGLFGRVKLKYARDTGLSVGEVQ